MDSLKTVTHYLKNTDLYLLILALICSGYGMVLIFSATLNPVSWQDGIYSGRGNYHGYRRVCGDESD